MGGGWEEMCVLQYVIAVVLEWCSDMLDMVHLLKCWAAIALTFDLLVYPDFEST